MNRTVANLPLPWKRLIKRCHDLKFGELSDCQVHGGSIIKVGCFVKSIFTQPKPIPPIFDNGQTVTPAWEELMTICGRESVKLIPIIKIEKGEPVRVCIDEGGWTSETK